MTPADLLTIPAFLRLTPEERNAAWEANPPKPYAATEAQAHWQARAAELKAEGKRKARARVAKLQDAHPGQRYDRKRRQWVPVG